MFPEEVESPASLALARIRGRVRSLNSLLAWQERIQAHERQLEAENHRLRADLFAAQHLIQSMQVSLGFAPAEAPPAPLVLAWHTGSPDDIYVAVPVDGLEWLLIVDGRPRIPNPVQEYHDWQQIKAVHRKLGAGTATLKALEEQ